MHAVLTHDRLPCVPPLSASLSSPSQLDMDAPPTHLGFSADPSVDQLAQWTAYSRSKLCNVLSALAASERLAPARVQVVSAHPGVDASTGLFRHMPKGALLMRTFGRFFGVQSTHQSVQTLLHCCLEEPHKLQTGAFYSQYYPNGYRDGQLGGWPMQSPNPLVNRENAAKLEALSYRALGIQPHPTIPKQDGQRGARSGEVEPTPPTATALEHS